MTDVEKLSAAVPVIVKYLAQRKKELAEIYCSKEEHVPFLASRMRQDILWIEETIEKIEDIILELQR
jgi:hypothetical protein